MPEPVQISVDEFVSKRSLVAKDGVVYRAAKMPKTFDASTRSATFVMTDETIDSYGDIVRAKGAKLDRFNDNPICLLNHRSDQILGTWSDVRQISKRVEGIATLAAEGTAPHVDMAYSLMSQGILRAASIGFMPLKVERRLDEDGEPLWSYDILEWDMYECSVVSIPANPSALAKSMKEGNMLARDFLEEVLDNYVKTPTGLILNIADIESAYKNANGDKRSIIVEKGSVVPNETKTEEAIVSDNGSIEKAAEPILSNDVISSFSTLVKDGDIVVLRDAEALKLVIERSGEQAGELILPVDMTIAQIKELQENVAQKSLANTEPGSVSVKVSIDTAEAEQKIDDLTHKAEGFVAKFGRLFGVKSSEPYQEKIIEQKAPPTAEEMEAARTKAAAIRERIASKGLIEA